MSHSIWINNLRVITKPDGSMRITTNSTALNKLVALYGYYLSNMDQMIYSIEKANFYSQIDIKDGFFQIPLKKEDIYKTVFRYGNRLYKWTVMSMGFKKVPAIFQRYMDMVLEGVLGKECICYLDNVIIRGSTEDGHDSHLAEVKQFPENNKLISNETESIYKV